MLQLPSQFNSTNSCHSTTGAGADAPKIPEGLNWQSVEAIALWVSSAGFNCVRLTYSMDMALNPTQKVASSFHASELSYGVLDNINAVFAKAVKNNPWLADASTLDVFRRVITALGTHGVKVILDNHTSHAVWCCSLDDGNGWWNTASGYNASNSRFFDTQKWLNGLHDMAIFSRDFPNVIGMGLRNELRAVGDQDAPGTSHSDWHKYVGQGAATVHAANPDLLISFGGVDYFNDFSFLRDQPFDRSKLDNKVVYEYHAYSWGSDVTGFAHIDNYTAWTNYMNHMFGYLLEEGKEYTGPIWFSEFGWAQIPELGQEREARFKEYMVRYLVEHDIDWAVWCLQGSYYINTGVVEADDTYGILNHNWTDWRGGMNFLETIGEMWITTKFP